MTFKISSQDVHTKQTNQKSFQTKRQHCCDPQCSGNNKLNDLILNLTPENMTQHSRIE